MPRLPYRPDGDLGPDRVVSAIRDRRRGDLLKMDRLMLHSPVFANGWNDFLRVVIEKLSLPERESQFVMCIIGQLNGADYEIFSHAPQFVAAGGSQAQLDALADCDRACDDEQLFSARERAVMRLTIEMTRNVTVRPATFAAARAILRDDGEMVELVGLVSTYNMVSRFVVALDIHPDDGRL